MKSRKSSYALFLAALIISAFNGSIIYPGSGGASAQGWEAFPDSTCKASFLATPDSLTSFPYLYHFKDISSGSINSWQWDFGDGSFSNEQNPSHQYQEPGDYIICLSIANENDPGNCSDVACQDISTLDYFSLGGLVYAGEHPLNNPVFEGDTGIASLYRFVNEQILFVEELPFQDYGYYWFGFLFSSDYLVKISLTEGSTHYGEYFITYYGDDIFWTKAETVNISGDNLYDNEIHLVPVQILPAGEGRIQGYVKFEQGNVINMPPIVKTSVILSDAGRTPLTYIHPDPAGYFEFSNIPFGSYYLTADATGKPATSTMVTLTEAIPEVEGINLTVFGSSTSFISEQPGATTFARIAPNPVVDAIYLHVNSQVSSAYHAAITDLTGRRHFTSTIYLETGYSQVIIPVEWLDHGFYFLTLHTISTDNNITVKFIK